MENLSEQESEIMDQVKSQIDNTKLLKIELLRQKNLKKLDRYRKFREFQPERFDEFQFAKCVGFDKALQCVIQILDYKPSDFDKEIEKGGAR